MHRTKLLFISSIVLFGTANCDQRESGRNLAASAPATASDKHVESTPEPTPLALAGYVHAPGEAYVHNSCIHQVPNGSRITPDGNGGKIVTLNGVEIEHDPACAYPVYYGPHSGRTPPSPTPTPGFGPSGGWVEYSQATASTIDGMSYFDYMTTGSFIVPAKPDNPTDSQLVFMFPSLTGSGYSGGGNIVQPVLQWGETTASGTLIGSYSSYVYTAWAEIEAPFYAGTPLTVSVNDTLSGFIELDYQYYDSEGGFLVNDWYISATDETTGQTSYLYAADYAANIENKAQGGVLEAYDMNNCGDFPGTAAGAYTVFGVASLYQAGPYWYSENSVTPAYTTTTNGYSGLSCDFDSAYSTSSGTTLEY